MATKYFTVAAMLLRLDSLMTSCMASTATDNRVAKNNNVAMLRLFKNGMQKLHGYLPAISIRRRRSKALSLKTMYAINFTTAIGQTSLAVYAEKKLSAFD